jgi:hypothetical protein
LPNLRQREAKIILERGGEAGLTGSNYLWVVTQSVVGDPKVMITLEKF